MGHAKVTNHKLPVLASIRVASPCQADWTEMTGDRRSRFCTRCQTQVFNLSEMSREQAERLIIERNGDLCARYYQRADGTLLTADCHQERKRRPVAAAAGIAAMLLGGSAAVSHQLADTGPTADVPPDLVIDETVSIDVAEVEAQHDTEVEAVKEINDKLVEDQVELIMGKISTIDHDQTLERLKVERAQIEKLKLELHTK
jgi:hypothetical protein